MDVKVTITDAWFFTMHISRESGGKDKFFFPQSPDFDSSKDHVSEVCEVSPLSTVGGNLSYLIIQVARQLVL